MIEIINSLKDNKKKFKLDIQDEYFLIIIDDVPVVKVREI